MLDYLYQFGVTCQEKKLKEKKENEKKKKIKFIITLQLKKFIDLKCMYFLW